MPNCVKTKILTGHNLQFVETQTLTGHNLNFIFAQTLTGQSLILFKHKLSLDKA